jgi:hypothetical protein
MPELRNQKMPSEEETISLLKNAPFLDEKIFLEVMPILARKIKIYFKEKNTN